MKNLFLRTILIIVLLMGCNSDNIIHSYYSFPEQNWKRFDNPIIEIDINKPGIFYDMWIELDYDVSKTLDEFLITVIMSTPSGEIRSRNLTLDMATGDGKIRVILRKDFAFSEKGPCTFEIENRSQNIETKGLKRIGIVLEKSK
ncbi:MAG: hypothetical protein DRI97_14690 [Bacteroidetes bacterium]|nr:MAG: hypothetical protein DRI97_14690 [Bacteroidota bacterium]